MFRRVPVRPCPLALAAAIVATAILGHVARAEAPRFLIEVEDNQVTVGEGFQVQVNLNASSEEISDYRPPDFKGLRVLYASRAPNQSTQMQFGSAGMIVQVTYSWRYQVAAIRAAVVSIGPARIRVNGQEFKSSVATVAAVAAGTPGGGVPPPLQGSGAPGAPGTPGAGASVPAPDSAGAETGQAGGSFIRMVPDKTKVVVGEAISATWFLYMNQPHDKYDTVVEPRMEGFWAEDATTPSRHGSLVLTQELIEGRPYQVGAILKKALFPLKPGRLTVTPMEADLSRVDFFGGATSQEHVRSPATLIDVSPLPAVGQPAGFDAANVGRFTLTARVDRSDVAVGEAITLSLEISGRGNLRKVALPELPRLPGWKTYDPRINAVIDPATGVTGTKSAEILLLPERAGTVRIPDLVLFYFDPDTRQYERAQAPGFALTARGDAIAAAAGATSAPADALVSGAPTTAGGAPPPYGPATENVLGGDIRPLRARTPLRSDVGTTFLHHPAFGVFVVAPPLLLALSLLGLRVRDRLYADTEGRRQRLNRRRVLGHLAAAESHRRQRQVGAFFAEIERVVRETLSSRLGRTVGGLHAEELSRHLRSSGLAEPDIAAILATLDECDRARFAPGTIADPEAMMAAAVERASALMGRLSKARLAEARPS